MCIKPDPTVDEIFNVLFEKRILVHITGTEAKELHEVLGRFQRGTFGLCKCCGQEIDSAELQRVPLQRFCSGCLKSGSGFSTGMLQTIRTTQHVIT